VREFDACSADVRCSKIGGVAKKKCSMAHERPQIIHYLNNNRAAMVFSVTAAYSVYFV
jgi:hypothetical protein